MRGTSSTSIPLDGCSTTRTSAVVIWLNVTNPNRTAPARVAAVFDWLRAHYTLEENPGLGAQGLYFYFHTMAKALSVHGVDELKLKDGRTVPWRRELAMELLNLQRRDGSWFNDNGRWRKKDAALVTACAVLTLSMTHQRL
jgi:squalene-hopene/tetraprenyl-beta-curcumene cyclase